MASLERAQSIRLRRYELRRYVREAERREGVRRLAEVLRSRDPALASQEVYAFLCWPRRMRTRGAWRLLLRERIGEGRTLGRLTDRQVEVIASWLDEVASAPERAAPDGAPGEP